MRLFELSMFLIVLVVAWMAHVAMSMNMVQRDLVSNIGVAMTLTTQVVTADVTTPTAAVDTRDFDSACFVVVSGAVVSSGIAKGLAYESDDGSVWTAVAAADLSTTFSNMTAAGQVVKVGYKGTKRYIGLGADYISGTSIVLTGLVIESDAHYKPVA